jgi:hypothetical protein
MVQMLSTGIPELSSTKDLEYLQEAFFLKMNEEGLIDHDFELNMRLDAIAQFRKLAWKSISTKTTQINFFVHNVASAAKSARISKKQETFED